MTLSTLHRPYIDPTLVRKLVFLYFNVNVYLKEIPCLNKVTLPYLTLPYGIDPTSTLHSPFFSAIETVVVVEMEVVVSMEDGSYAY